uniref:Uncharacterized protein n=1 Tax=Shewanella decolorationis TaxID=256839 RepID=A0A5B8QSD0_9GAMM
MYLGLNRLAYSSLFYGLNFDIPHFIPLISYHLMQINVILATPWAKLKRRRLAIRISLSAEPHEHNAFLR